MMRSAQFFSGFTLATLMLLAAPALAQSSTPIKEIVVESSVEVDRPRILAVLPFRVGDLYSVSTIEQGLLRLAESGKYQALDSRFDLGEGRLTLQLEPYETLSEVRAIVSGAADPATETLVRDDVIEVAGVSNGDPIDVDQLGEIRERVRRRLADRGFRSAKVLVYIEKLPEVTSEKGADLGSALSVAIELGTQSIVTAFQLDGVTAADFGEFWDILGDQRSLRPSLRRSTYRFVSANQVQTQIAFDWVAINQAVSAWGLKARLNSYYDFKVELTIGGQAGGGDVAVLNLRRGPRYNLQFKGNTTFWERELRDKVLDRTRRLGIPFDLRDAIDRVTALYQAKGYAQVEVETSAKENDDEKTVEFKIKQGPQYTLGHVAFIGVQPEDEASMSDALREWIDPLESPLHRPFYDEKLLRGRLPLLVRSVRDRGYLQARILEYRPAELSGQRRVGVEIPIQLGPRYSLRTLTISGNTVLSDTEIDQLIDVKLGDPVNPTRIFAGIERIRQRYRELGFIYVRVPEQEADVIKTTPELAAIDAAIDIEPGPQVFVGQVIVRGSKRTKDKVVSRELKVLGVETGKEWNPFSVQAAEQKLLSLGIFSAAKIDAIGGRVLNNNAESKLIEQNERDLKVSVSERAFGSLEFGPGYRTDLGLVVFGELSYRNIGGWNRQVLLRTQASRKLTNYQFIEQRHSLTYLEPFFLDGPTRFQVALSYIREDDMRFEGGQAVEGINYDEIAIGAALDRQLGRYFRLSHNLYRISLPRIVPAIENQPAFDRERVNYRVATMGSLLSFDTRDNIFNATTGWFTGTSFTYSSPFIGSDDNANFLILRQNISRYFRLGSSNSADPNAAAVPKPSLAFALNYAHLWGLGNTKGVPENVRLGLGGRTSIRSLNENQLRNVNPGLIEQRSLEFKAEYRQPILLDFGLAYFVDAGAVDSLRFRDPAAVISRPCLTSIQRMAGCFSYGIGFGLRLVTPVGPLALDFAFNPSPAKAEGEDSLKVQFNIGSF